jgi:hypothetical protein
MTGFQLLSAVFIDRNYNGKAFEMTDYYFLEDIKEENGQLLITLPKASKHSKMMVVYTDVLEMILLRVLRLGGGFEMSQVTEIKSFKQSDLVLKVRQAYNPEKLDFASWMPYINNPCGDREYQKEAIKNAVIYLASGNYSALHNLASENYMINQELRDKYATEEEFLKAVQLSDKLYATIDLATGTGNRMLFMA